MKKNIVVLGATGMLGHKVINTLRRNVKNFNIIGLGSKEYDFSTFDVYDIFANKFTPDETQMIVNCAGLLRQRISKVPTPVDYIKAFMLNTFLPQALSSKYNLIHITTDCVYSGTKGKYVENDLHDEMDLYGKSKSMGEPIGAMCLRTSIVGPEISGRNLSLYNWFMDQKDNVRGFGNHMWNGMTTQTLANCISKIIKEDLFSPGVKHLFSNTISKYTMLELFNQKRTNPIYIEETQANISVDRTLSTIDQNFINQFNIPFLEQQIACM